MKVGSLVQSNGYIGIALGLMEGSNYQWEIWWSDDCVTYEVRADVEIIG
jgi:hypothetical protein